MRSLLIIMACALAVNAHAQNTKRPSIYVIDGDSVSIDNQDIRLWGIDAPEIRQTCASEQEAGRIARAFLMHLIDDKPLRCKYKGRDRYGRSLMICLNHEQRDISRLMVEAGWAWAAAQFTTDYLEYEVYARRHNLGVHGMRCALPWSWRQHHGRGGSPTPLPPPR